MGLESVSASEDVIGDPFTLFIVTCQHCFTSGFLFSGLNLLALNPGVVNRALVQIQDLRFRAGSSKKSNILLLSVFVTFVRVVPGHVNVVDWLGASY